jgi:hypothetical protein
VPATVIPSVICTILGKMQSLPYHKQPSRARGKYIIGGEIS